MYGLGHFYSWNSNPHNLSAWTVSCISFPFSLRITDWAFIRCRYVLDGSHLYCYWLSLYSIAYSICPIRFRSAYCAFCEHYFIFKANLQTIIRSCSNILDIFIYFCYESMLLGFLSACLQFSGCSLSIFFASLVKRSSYFLFINITIID